MYIDFDEVFRWIGMITCGVICIAPFAYVFIMLAVVRWG